jgi:tRNA(Ile)-lysidine synthetase-like protein
MDIQIPEGKYVLAVSGGIDSMVLLDLLAGRPELELVVAHFDHGIRQNSAADATFVAAAVKQYGLPFELGIGQLGSPASEASARARRYEFLEEVRNKHAAKAIITAHHQDDLIETAIINLVRGTGAQGIYAMLDNDKVVRPLIDYPKVIIESYAKEQNLTWREDETNQDSRYLRNRVRGATSSKLDQASRQRIINLIHDLRTTHQQTKRLIAELADQILVDKTTVSRQAFIKLPPEVSNAFMHDWLTSLDVRDLDRPTVERLSLAIKTGGANTTQDIKKGYKLGLTKTTAQFRNTDKL